MATATRQKEDAMKRATSRRSRMLLLATALGVIVILASGLNNARASAVFTVTNTADSGLGSLRQAILDANATAGANTINFDPSVTGTITLMTGQLPDITNNLVVTGPGAASLTINGNNTSRVFLIANGITVTISGLTISN